MDEIDFKILKVLDETKNITHAADKLFISQSALSKRISAMENNLGTSIILRSRSGIQFTPEGEEVLRRTKAAAQELALMRTFLDSKKEYISGTLNIGASINYSNFKLPKILAEYREKFPYVKTNVSSNQSRSVYDQLTNHDIEIAIVRGEFAWNEHKILLDEEKICLIYNKKYIDTPLNDIPYIGRKTDLTFEREVNQWMRENNIEISNHGIFVDNINTCVEMVSLGLGWAIVPEIGLSSFNGHIEFLTFKNGEAFVRKTYLMYNDLITSLPQAEAFIQTIIQYEDRGDTDE